MVREKKNATSKGAALAYELGCGMRCSEVKDRKNKKGGKYGLMCWFDV